MLCKTESKNFLKKKTESKKIDGKYCQPTDFRKLPKGMQPKELWNQSNFVLEENVRCMKNISVRVCVYIDGILEYKFKN